MVRTEWLHVQPSVRTCAPQLGSKTIARSDGDPPTAPQTQGHPSTSHTGYDPPILPLTEENLANLSDLDALDVVMAQVAGLQAAGARCSLQRATSGTQKRPRRPDRTPPYCDASHVPSKCSRVLAHREVLDCRAPRGSSQLESVCPRWGLAACCGCGDKLVRGESMPDSAAMDDAPRHKPERRASAFTRVHKPQFKRKLVLPREAIIEQIALLNEENLANLAALDVVMAQVADLQRAMSGTQEARQNSTASVLRHTPTAARSTFWGGDWHAPCRAGALGHAVPGAQGSAEAGRVHRTGASYEKATPIDLTKEMDRGSGDRWPGLGELPGWIGACPVRFCESAAIPMTALAPAQRHTSPTNS
jgi:hypothetical protein